MDDLLGVRGTENLQGAFAEARLQRALAAAEHGDQDVAAQKLEGLFASMLVKELRGTLGASMFGDGPGKDVFEGWFDEKLGETLSEAGALELSGLVKASLGAQRETEEGK